MVVPNVLANRYAGADLAAIWSPEHKIVLERHLWIAVLKAQRDLGVEVPDGVVEAYEAVVDRVEYQGAFILHTVRLASGRTVRSGTSCSWPPPSSPPPPSRWRPRSSRTP